MLRRGTTSALRHRTLPTGVPTTGIFKGNVCYKLATESWLDSIKIGFQNFVDPLEHRQ